MPLILGCKCFIVMCFFEKDDYYRVLKIYIKNPRPTGRGCAERG